MTTGPRPTLASGMTASLALVWLGMLIGVSFLATPVKFEAPSLSLPVALEVGHVTFKLFSRVEIALAALLMIALLAAFRRAADLIAGALLVAAVGLQSLWLLPVLDARIEAVIAGAPLPASRHHFGYAALEAGKAVVLAVIGFRALRRLRGV
ncbi:DUF4149 domain-containing protein [Pseudohoeflea coraliihabitans]|uniref:DUF4149 domain-containing protein n=1 Tax=Pseudohoeflea coraliihabitans TaxID=2860393 RepID=A0ABS6WQP7_9HYPH|nr:DUF4149 domain-containing protein [Pseudohoeflea sp. DP4N28-3]MBW3098296.1 DUF4149 domain-containing protein [Pseudohoeflea sp. DP4N28-3]